MCFNHSNRLAAVEEEAGQTVSGGSTLPYLSEARESFAGTIFLRGDAFTLTLSLWERGNFGMGFWAGLALPVRRPRVCGDC